MENVASLLPGSMQQPIPESCTNRDRVFYVIVVGVAILRIVTPGILPVPMLDRIVEEMEPPGRLLPDELSLVEVDASDSLGTSLPPYQVRWIGPDTFSLNIDLVRNYQALAMQDTGNEESLVVFDPFPQWKDVQAEAASDGRNLGLPPVLAEGVSGMI